MADRETHEEGEQLFDTYQTDDYTTPATDTEEEEETSETEQEQDDLDLGEEQGTTSKAEEKKQKQVRAWQRKIEDGEATLEDLPPNLGWLKGDLKKALGVKPEVDTADIKALLREEIKLEKEAVRFSDLQDELNTNLDSEQKARVANAYERLRAKKLPKLDSLELALEVAGIDLDKMGVDAKRSRMKIPSPGRKSNPTIADMDDMSYSEIVKAFPDKEKRQEYLRSKVS